MPAKVLIVEDDLLNRMFYEAALSDRGYEVAMVDDGARVIDEVHAFKPDLITMDIQLPNVSGVQLIKRLQKDETTRDIPILAITAFCGKGKEDRIRRAGARGYIAKPVTIPRLVGEIDAILGEAAQ